MSDHHESSSAEPADRKPPPTPGHIDYDLDDQLTANTPERMKALAEPLRLAICDVVLERAMTVTQLASTFGRPRGTIAYHVNVLVDADLLRVVRTRQVRALEERFYGRTARTFVMAKTPGQLPFFDELAGSVDATAVDHPRFSTLRRARVSDERAEEYNRRLHELALEFSREPRTGETEYALLIVTTATTRFGAVRRDSDTRPATDDTVEGTTEQTENQP